MAPNMTQAYLANMGYLVLDAKYLMDKTPVDGGHLPGEGITEERRNNEQIGDIVEHILARAKIPTNTTVNLRRFGSRYWALNPFQWQQILDWECVDRPEISSSQLAQLDRGGSLVKFLVLIQVAYLIVQLILRKMKSLPSQIEIAALAFAVCSMITYALYWDRPQGVESIHIIKPKRRLSTDLVHRR